MPNVLITGCSSGIGHATAARLARSGRWTVYATARKVETLAALETAGCRTLALDVTDEASMTAAVAAVEGGVDVLDQQRRLLPVGRARDAADGRGPPPVRDERVRGAADGPARAARHAGEAGGDDRQRLLDGRPAHVPGRRRLPRHQVRDRGDERRAADGGRPLRRGRDLRRAGADPDGVLGHRGRRRGAWTTARTRSSTPRSRAPRARSTAGRWRGSAATPTASRSRSRRRC